MKQRIKDLQDLTLVGHTRNNKVLDPLAVPHLNNRLCMYWYFYIYSYPISMVLNDGQKLLVFRFNFKILFRVLGGQKLWWMLKAPPANPQD